MEELFYKVTSIEAALIGKFEYEPNKFFDPFCSEQEDGTFLVSDKMVDLLKEDIKIKRVDFDRKEKIDESEFRSKDSDAIVVEGDSKPDEGK